MRQRRQRQLAMRFDHDVDMPDGYLPKDIAHDVVNALADLLLAAVLGRRAR